MVAASERKHRYGQDRAKVRFQEHRHPPCPLCERSETSWFYRDPVRGSAARRDYYKCGLCHLIFVPPEQRLSPEVEIQRYQMHENRPDDPEYRKFLNRMVQPLDRVLKPNSNGLDFGAGPGPTLNVMLEERGHTVSLYDAFFAPDLTVFDRTYDFITSTETVEHLFEPRMELDRLWSCLKPGGWLGIMTQRVDQAPSFATWHYKNDDTHVLFFSEKSFRWLCRRWDAELEFYGRDVVLYQKPAV